MTTATNSVAEELSNCLTTSHITSTLIEQLTQLFSETCALRLCLYYHEPEEHDKVLMSCNLLQDGPLCFTPFDGFLPESARSGQPLIISNNSLLHLPACLSVSRELAPSLFSAPLLSPASSSSSIDSHAFGTLLLNFDATDNATALRQLKQCLFLAQSLATGYEHQLCALSRDVFRSLYPPYHAPWGALAQLLTGAYATDEEMEGMGEDVLSDSQQAFWIELQYKEAAAALMRSCHPLKLHFREPGLEAQFLHWRDTHSMHLDNSVFVMLVTFHFARLVLVAIDGAMSGRGAFAGPGQGWVSCTAIKEMSIGLLVLSDSRPWWEALGNLAVSRVNALLVASHLYNMNLIVLQKMPFRFLTTWCGYLEGITALLLPVMLRLPNMWQLVLLSGMTSWYWSSGGQIPPSVATVASVVTPGKGGVDAFVADRRCLVL